MVPWEIFPTDVARGTLPRIYYLVCISDTQFFNPRIDFYFPNFHLPSNPIREAGTGPSNLLALAY